MVWRRDALREAKNKIKISGFVCNFYIPLPTARVASTRGRHLSRALAVLSPRKIKDYSKAMECRRITETLDNDNDDDNDDDCDDDDDFVDEEESVPLHH